MDFVCKDHECPVEESNDAVKSDESSACSSTTVGKEECEKNADDDGHGVRCAVTPSAENCRKICSMGTGEVMTVLAFKAGPGKLEAFECTAQSVARSLYALQVGLTDVRVCHPRPGDVIFMLTFLSPDERAKFKEDYEVRITNAMKKVCVDEKGNNPSGAPVYADGGCLMPACHTLSSLLDYLEANVKGKSYLDHNVEAVGREVGRWYPRLSEYEKYIHWDKSNPKKYTRNLVFANEHMDVLLMCWPPDSESAIHCHDESSCWVGLVSGEVSEIQYSVPVFDRKFMQSELENPTGAVGKCSKLRVVNETKLSLCGLTTAYAANNVALHKVVNRSLTEPAYTLHIYAPGIRKMKVFKESGLVTVTSVGSVKYTSKRGVPVDGDEGMDLNPDGVIDAEAWNSST